MARHIIGGDVFYECVFRDTIEETVRLHFEFQMYRDGRDPMGADFDGGPNSQTPGAEFGLFKRVGENWVYITKTAPLVYVSRARVDPNTQPCLITPPGILVERAVYEFDFTVRVDGSDYMVAYQRCCRSNSISNLINPGDFGAAFAIEIMDAALRSCNNSPKFNEFPPLIICAGFPLEYDHSAADIEGDQITYEFCRPLSAGGNPGQGSGPVPRSDCDRSVAPDPQYCGPNEFIPVQFQAPSFTFSAPMGGNPVVQIDRNTGQISGTPQIIGEHVMAVCAEEYRDGVLLSVIRRDFQFVVSGCEKAVDAAIVSDRELNENEFELKLCGDFDVQFQNLSTREIDIKEYLWEFDINGSTLTSSEKNPLITFPELGEYRGKMTINPDVENCTDSVDVLVKIFPGLEADFEFAYDTCIAGPVTFTDLSYTDADFLVSRIWDFGDGTVVDRFNPLHTYELPGTKSVSLRIEDNNGCVDVENEFFSYAPAPSLIVVEPSTFIGCEPAEVFFNNLTFPIDDTYDILWDFGDGSSGDEVDDISPTHIYEDDGVYSVNVQITSPLGCITERTYRDWVRVQNGPEADFTFSPEEPSIRNSTVDFFDQSIGGISYFWDFGGQSISFDRNPTYTFRDTGVHQVYLQVTSANGCTDTQVKFVDVIPVADMFFPNAFTPNGDGRNDKFLGAGTTALINDYELTIYDRWGKVVYQSNDPLEGWNGQLNNSGTLLPQGVYMYLVSYRIPRGEMKQERGFATLVR